MLNVDHLTKRYGTVVAVDGLSFQVGPGRVTGFLGPNGACTTPRSFRWFASWPSPALRRPAAAGLQISRKDNSDDPR